MLRTGVVAVLGHRGFIGRAVVGRLEERGLSVRRCHLARIDAAPRPQIGDALERWADRNAVAYTSLVKELEGCAAVVNAAGAAAPDSSDYRLLWSSNTLLPAVVAHAAGAARVGRLVHVSSAAVQGDCRVLDESDRVRPRSPYAKSKAAGEAALREPGASRPAETVIYRPTSVMSTERPTTRRLLSWFRTPLVLAGGRDTPLPLALLENVADAVAHLTQVDQPPPLVTHPDESMTIGALADLVGARLLPLPRFFTHPGLATLRAAETFRPELAGVRRRAELLLLGQRVEANALARSGWRPLVGTEGYRALTESVSKGPIRIAYLVTRSDTVAGAQIHVRDLALAMCDAGHVVRVFVGGDGPYVDQLRDRGLDVVPIKRLGRALTLRDASALRETRRALREFGPDLLSCHSTKSGILGRLAGYSLGVPTLFTAHGWSFAEGIPGPLRGLGRALEFALAPLAARLITVAHSDRELAARYRIGAARQHATVHNAVHDVEPELRSEPGAQPPTLVCVARFDDQKDHALLFRALAELDEVPRTLLVGDGPKEPALRALAEELGIAGRLQFMGLRHDVAALLARSQLYVLSSRWEGLPRSIIEAMRAGLPIIASDVGGVAELVVDGVNGRLVPRGDGESLRRALSDLLGDAPARVEMGERSRARYEKHFTFDRVLCETRAIYAEVVKRPV